MFMQSYLASQWHTSSSFVIFFWRMAYDVILRHSYPVVTVFSDRCTVHKKCTLWLVKDSKGVQRIVKGKQGNEFLSSVRSYTGVRSYPGWRYVSLTSHIFCKRCPISLHIWLLFQQQKVRVTNMRMVSLCIWATVKKTKWVFLYLATRFDKNTRYGRFPSGIIINCLERYSIHVHRK